MKKFVRPLIGCFIGFNLANLVFHLYSGTFILGKFTSDVFLSTITLSMAFLIIWGMYQLSQRTDKKEK